MNAKEARQKAYEINTAKTNSQYAEIKADIDEEVGKGKYKCFHYKPILPDVRTKLIEEGFKFGSEFSSQKDGTTIEICW